jgi:hypothetical protein
LSHVAIDEALTLSLVSNPPSAAFVQLSAKQTLLKDNDSNNESMRITAK